MTPHHLDHSTPECTGRWNREFHFLTADRWRCSDCGRSYPATPETIAAAAAENRASMAGNLAADEGARLIHRETQPVNRLAQRGAL